MAEISLDRIERAEEDLRQMYKALDELGRELFGMRHAGSLVFFSFNGYRRTTYSSMNRQENPLTPEWEESQPIIELDYICPDDRPYHDEDEHVYLTIPEIWLDQDWRALEKVRLQAYREQKAKAREHRKAKQEARGPKP